MAGPCQDFPEIIVVTRLTRSKAGVEMKTKQVSILLIQLLPAMLMIQSLQLYVAKSNVKFRTHLTIVALEAYLTQFSKQS